LTFDIEPTDFLTLKSRINGEAGFSCGAFIRWDKWKEVWVHVLCCLTERLLMDAHYIHYKTNSHDYFLSTYLWTHTGLMLLGVVVVVLLTYYILSSMYTVTKVLWFTLYINFLHKHISSTIKIATFRIAFFKYFKKKKSGWPSWTFRSHPTWNKFTWKTRLKSFSVRLEHSAP